jgi:hypothetical protein
MMIERSGSGPKTCGSGGSGSATLVSSSTRCIIPALWHITGIVAPVSVHVKTKTRFSKFLLCSYFNYARNEPLDSMWTRYLLKSLNSSQVGRNTMMLGTSVLEPGYDLHKTETVPLSFIKYQNTITGVEFKDPDQKRIELML